MKKLIFAMILIGVIGCAGKRTGVVRKTPDGVEFDMKGNGVISYKDKDVEASMDTKKRAGIIEDIIKVLTIKEIGKR